MEKNNGFGRVDTREGLIISYYGASALVEDATGEKIHCHIRKNMEPCITGDKVLWKKENDTHGLIIQVLPRTCVLSRPEKHKEKLLAANIDTFIIVLSCVPKPSYYFLDRYLIAAKCLNLNAIILVHKIDLLERHSLKELESELSIYKDLNYFVIFSSLYTENGLQNIEKALRNKRSIFLGASGVGKSSIIAALTKNPNIHTNLAPLGMGKHTTTATHLYHLPADGYVIDSPGVREFKWKPKNFAEILEAYVDFGPYISSCKFRNCHHQEEPSCAVVQAVEEHKISPVRYENYVKMLAALKQP